MTNLSVNQINAIQNMVAQGSTREEALAKVQEKSARMARIKPAGRESRRDQMAFLSEVGLPEKFAGLYWD